MKKSSIQDQADLCSSIDLEMTVGMVADESCRNFKKGTNFFENLCDSGKICEKI